MSAQTARLVAGGAGLVATSVLFDSGLEHYRGSFKNPAMVLPLTASAGSIAVTALRASGAGGGVAPWLRGAAHAYSVAIGSIGLGFHAFNVDKRPGGLTVTNLFYGAPLGAPAALILAGALGAAGDALAGDGKLGPLSLGDGRIVGAFAAVGIAGTVAEASLLHFRGAFQNPFMWAPVLLPPLAAVALGVDAARGDTNAVTTGLLAVTAVLGIAGVGFHAWGIAREMGGWRNWRQTILSGPPLPAPPSFTGLAVAGIGALMLIRKAARG